jgi:DNA-binding Lrp family transcriptional regulator
MKLDKIDLNIIKMLEKNSKLIIYDIAKELKIPASTVHNRIKRLDENKVIKKWTIVPNWEKIEKEVKTYILVYVNTSELKEMKKTQKDLGKELLKMENVSKADVITGEADLLIEIRTKNIQDLEKMLLEKIQGVKGIVKTKTILCLKEIE